MYTFEPVGDPYKGMVAYVDAFLDTQELMIMVEVIDLCGEKVMISPVAGRNTCWVLKEDLYLLKG